MNSRRLTILGVLAALLAVLIGLDRTVDKDRADHVLTGLAASGLQPIAAPAGALGSTFYCAGGTAAADGAFDQTIVIANPAATPVNAMVTTYPGAIDGDAENAAAIANLQPVSKAVTVAPRSRLDVHLSELQQSPYAAAVVEAAGGELAVEHRISGMLGTDSGPCASSASASWYLPTGSTTKDARELLAVFNPFPGDAVVDMEFATSEGHRDPSRYRNYVVPGRRLRVIDIGVELQRHEQVATSLVATTGRVVVERLQIFDGSEANHPAGLGVTLAAPQLSPVWVFPEGSTGGGVSETFIVYNPADGPAEVDLDIVLDQPDVNGTVDPIHVSVPSGGYGEVLMNEQQRVPEGVGHTVTVRSTNGAEVAAERVITSTTPAPRKGYAPGLGSPLLANRWLLADGRADATTAEFLTIANPGDSIARVSVHALAQGTDLAIDGLQDVEIAPHGRLAIDLGAHVNRADLPVLVDSDQPVVVERGLFLVGKPGISFAVGIPLADSLAEPSRDAPVTTTTTLPPPDEDLGSDTTTTAPTTTAPTTTAPTTTTAGPTTTTAPPN